MSSAIFERGDVAAWCYVPYDTVQRTPQQRAALLAKLGIAAAVWDWRDEHLPLFGQELRALEDQGIHMAGIWCPLADPGASGVPSSVASLVSQSAHAGLTPQLWTCLEFGPPWEGPPDVVDQEARVAAAAARTAPLAALAAEHGMTVGLYNHMGWAGEPENLMEVADALAAQGLTNVGLVYQQHHGHTHVDRWARLWPVIAPRVIALGLNGMIPLSVDPTAAARGRKIHPYGRGPQDVVLARIVAESGWDGLLTLLGHTMDDVELRLRDNLEGLDWVAEQLRGDGPDAPPPARIPEPVWPH